MDIIRLTDEKLIDELTFDRSDSFYWLKQQAARGVTSAQVIEIDSDQRLFFFPKEEMYRISTSMNADSRVCQSSITWAHLCSPVETV